MHCEKKKIIIREKIKTTNKDKQKKKKIRKGKKQDQIKKKNA